MGQSNNISSIATAWAVILAIVVGVPFLNKPFHIDDTVYLAVSEQILNDPLRPFSGEINWRSDLESLFDIDSSPPLLSYYLAPYIAAFGYSEVALHAGMLLFLAILSLSVLKLSHRFANGSWWPVLFVMASPLVVVSSNVMKDVPMAALATASVALFIQGCDEDSFWLLVSGSLLAGLAMLTKYSAVVIFPLLALYPLSRGRIKPAFFLVLGVMLVGLWFTQNILVHGTTHLQNLVDQVIPGMPWQEHAFSGLAILGAGIFLLPAVLLTLLHRRELRALQGFLFTWFLLIIALSAYFPQKISGQFYLWSVFGSGLLWYTVWGLFPSSPDAFLAKLKEKNPIVWAKSIPEKWLDSAYLMFWLVLVIYFSIFHVYFQAARHLIPALVPLVLLVIRFLQRDQDINGRFAKLVLTMCLTAQIGVSMWVGAADYAYADTYRQYAKQMEIELKNQTDDVWFMGHWGWQHYAINAGWKQLSANGPRPEIGDLLLIPRMVDKGTPPKGLVAKIESSKIYPNKLNMLTMNNFNGASFYAVVGTNLPYLYSKDGVLEVISIYRVAGYE